ncbi:hypothetical protein PIB30_073715, partial [Stylosanthes scabra]|nr:hypothetical protein [Stylosanthes scabra]
HILYRVVNPLMKEIQYPQLGLATSTLPTGIPLDPPNPARSGCQLDPHRSLVFVARLTLTFSYALGRTCRTSHLQLSPSIVSSSEDSLPILPISESVLPHGSRSGRPLPDLGADRQHLSRSACKHAGRAQLSRSACYLPIKALSNFFYHSSPIFHSHSSLSSRKALSSLHSLSSTLYLMEPENELLRGYEDTMYRHDMVDHIAGRLGQLV